MSNQILKRLDYLENVLTEIPYKGPTTTAELSDAIISGKYNPEDFPGLTKKNGFSMTSPTIDRKKYKISLIPSSPEFEDDESIASDIEYVEDYPYPSRPGAVESVDVGTHIDSSNFQARLIAMSKKELKNKEGDSEFQRNVNCPLTDNELLSAELIFTAWTGIDPYGISPDETEYRKWTFDEMINELNKVKSFLGQELNRTLGLSGVMAKINEAMFMNELDRFTEDELMGYAVMFHMDLSRLQDTQESLANYYAAYMSTETTTVADLERRQIENEIVFLNELKSIIIDFKVWMIERLRLWRWREEVYLGRVGDALATYPGIEVKHSFESTTELLSVNMSNYFLRGGEVKRETLMDRYKFFDLYHMAGMLSSGVSRDVTFDTNMKFEDLADLIIALMDDMELEPRHVVTPLGVQVIHNQEKGEVLYNLYRNQSYDSETLYLACTHAGIQINKETEVELEDETVFVRRQNKPQYVLAEELASQYLSPQFYTGIEAHREWTSALSTFTTLSGDRVVMGEDGDYLFFGVGDGVSVYRVYRPSELAEVFSATDRFIDPYSFFRHEDMPQKWSSFSIQSIHRLTRVVLPQLRAKSKTSRRRDIDFLEETIFKNLNIMDGDVNFDPNDPTVGEMIKPRRVQDRIIKKLTRDLESIRGPLMEFLVALWNTGVQFSDWWTKMIKIDENTIASAIVSDPTWKHIDPETTVNLTEKITKMLVIDIEKYINVMSLKGERYGRMIKSLRLIKFYHGAYRIDWDDELSTIEGHLYRMVQANNMSYYQHLRTSGNWLMATANFYSVKIFGQVFGDISISFLSNPVHPTGYAAY